jgi:hypothetical protein
MGLGKFGDPEAIRFLADMLYDPDVTHARGYSPGVSLRAAQALCDIKNWLFTWNKDFLEANRDQWTCDLQQPNS